MYPCIQTVEQTEKIQERDGLNRCGRHHTCVQSSPKASKYNTTPHWCTLTVPRIPQITDVKSNYPAHLDSVMTHYASSKWQYHNLISRPSEWTNKWFVNYTTTFNKFLLYSMLLATLLFNIKIICKVHDRKRHSRQCR